MKQPINLLVVEDSAVERALLLHVFESDPGIRVVGVAANGIEAIEAVCRLHPDVVTMDVHMPKLEGVEATRQIMERCPVPVVILSASAQYEPEGQKAFRALEAGAVALARKPPGIGHPGHRERVEDLLQVVRLMSEIAVVRLHPRPVARTAMPAPAIETAAAVRLIAIGASAGGPMALKRILSGLGDRFALPILIVQHMMSGFAEGFAAWLGASTGFPVRIAADREVVGPRHAYLAPDDRQMGIDADGRIVLSDAAADEGHRPSVAHLFRSVAHAYGAAAAGVLLTGMGRDGAAELRQLRDAGAPTIAQDESTSLVFGMPGEAVRLRAAAHVLPLEQIPAVLMRLSGLESPHG